MKTKAALIEDYGEKVHVGEVDLRDPGPGEVLVEIAASGVCHSDLHVVTGDLPLPVPMVLGHEAAGIIRAVGPGVTSRKTGESVVLSWIPPCGSCRFCLEGQPQLCTRAAAAAMKGKLLAADAPFSRGGQVVHSFSLTGTLSQYTVVPAQGAIPLPEGVPLDKAALLGCAVMTGVGAAMNTAALSPGQSVAVFGAGGVGLSVIQGARIAGASQIIAVDRVPLRLDLARQLGATDILNTNDEDPVDGLLSRTGGYGPDVTFEAIGRPETIVQAFNAVRKGGTAVIVGVAPPHEEISLNAFAFPSQEKTLKGSWYGSSDPTRALPKLARLVRSGQLRLDPMVTRTYGLEDAPLAFDDLAEGRVGRPVVHIGLLEEEHHGAF